MAKLNHNMALVKEKAAEYKQATEDVATKRALWLNTTKAFILKILRRVKRAEKLDWMVGKVEENANLEAVTLAFKDQPSGITGEVVDEATQKSTNKELTKYGGVLIFSQTYNGDILTIVTMPSIEGDTEPQISTIVDRVPPTEITEDYLLEHVLQFLDAMTEWETSTTDKDKHIGFRIG